MKTEAKPAASLSAHAAMTRWGTAAAAVASTATVVGEFTGISASRSVGAHAKGVRLQGIRGKAVGSRFRSPILTFESSYSAAVTRIS
ncbi:hypothetical protein GCM10009530_60010 [Microbispora corallina]|uniref:Secreted protein n=1 Tax=Microbispora corallina TaxID=83302 RepID=A0ABQ4FYV1_9ACTN|nr:hypothetical protein Mco01_29870 [Microbispora corallina]